MGDNPEYVRAMLRAIQRAAMRDFRNSLLGSVSPLALRVTGRLDGRNNINVIGEAAIGETWRYGSDADSLGEAHGNL